MDFKKSKALLKKINVLHDSALDFEGSMTSMERDLLLQYLRDLYEMILHEGQSDSVLPARERSVSKVEVAPISATVRNVEPVQSAPVPKAAPVITQSSTEEIFAEKPSIVEPKPEGGKKKEKLAVLFASDDSKDLRSKFSSLPISDISKSMGINDKILTINELFGGDQSLFNNVVKELNGFNSFNEAQQYLIGDVAKKQGWYEDQKKGKAMTFIKLIRRRYI